MRYEGDGSECGCGRTGLMETFVVLTYQLLEAHKQRQPAHKISVPAVFLVL